MESHLIDMQNKKSIEFQGKTNFNPRAQFRLAVMATWLETINTFKWSVFSQSRGRGKAGSFYKFYNCKYNIWNYLSQYDPGSSPGVGRNFSIRYHVETESGAYSAPFQLVLRLFFRGKFVCTSSRPHVTF
jgi:hypothetical protein